MCIRDRSTLALFQHSIVTFEGLIMDRLRDYFAQQILDKWDESVWVCCLLYGFAVVICGVAIKSFSSLYEKMENDIVFNRRMLRLLPDFMIMMSISILRYICDGTKFSIKRFYKT
eukprot:TRINITY_DN12204_c0_g1_i2.p2 TRINITY_DN12204_c0_g1~~TRINITY_DN12204_c0_g1_i2.p2  ORF type:complete len:124 (+),score=18.47 TRINITY_DN12204_c0_g1_i2:29-373(+)